MKKWRKHQSDTEKRGNSSPLPSSHCPATGTANCTEVEGVVSWGKGTWLVACQNLVTGMVAEKGAIVLVLIYINIC